jgi:hypothetical protein
MLAATAALAACSGVPGGGGTAEVVYSLESDAPPMSATYATADSGGVSQQQDTEVTSPWPTTVTAEDDLVQSFVLVRSMNPVLDGSGGDGTTMTCRITVDGEVVSEQILSSGWYRAAPMRAGSGWRLKALIRTRLAEPSGWYLRFSDVPECRDGRP